MEPNKNYLKSRCVRCGSRALHAFGEDQLCLDCDWTNAKYLVDLGRMDDPFRAVMRHFGESCAIDVAPARSKGNSRGRQIEAAA